MNICALSTAQGGAISIVRVSGPDAISIVGNVFQPARRDFLLTQAKGQSLHFGKFVSAGEVIDEVLVSVFRAPHSYTGENAVEISCHGSRYITSSILQTLVANGCRQANPGEFTQRAFLNGKMDLSQAEAVADLIASTNAATHKMAMSQLRGNFSSELARLRDKLLELTSLMELELDFSDHEDLEFADRSQLSETARQIAARISRLKNSFATGQALKNGIPVAIVGKTNVGKSTLLNCLLHDDKAIVSDIHGTTRDVIEDTISIQGIDFRFIDTAGLRETADAIERLGIERTRQKMQEAAIILHLADNAEDFWVEAAQPKETQERKTIKVLTKIDRLSDSSLSNISPDIIPISAKTGANINLLESAIVAAADIPTITANDVVVTSTRHYEALFSALSAINRVIDGMSHGIPSDLLSEDLRDCLAALAEIVGGAITTDEVLGNIFSKFCVGK